MPTYILIHDPFRRNRAGVPESPAWEITGNICGGNLATTAFGGWNIDMNEGEIKPGDRLLFYRSNSGIARGYFAVGCVLPADHPECCELRRKGLREWYRDNPEADELDPPLNPELAAYKALGWDKGKGKTTHINAVWNAVAHPKKGWALSPCLIDKRFLVLDQDKRPKTGIRMRDEEANSIYEKCMASMNVIRA